MSHCDIDMKDVACDCHMTAWFLLSTQEHSEHTGVQTQEWTSAVAETTLCDLDLDETEAAEHPWLHIQTMVAS